jgi:CheY-like chemotaxis protein
MSAMKTLVASHNPDLARDFDRDLLRRRDLRLVTARTIAELLERLRAGAHLCFIDRVLPDGDAALALAAIRTEKRLAAIPVVLVIATGAPPVDRAQARAAGFADVVQLPAPPGALSLLVARLLGVPLREGDRFALRVHVFESEESAPQYLGTSVDLSEAGVLLKTRRNVAVGTRLGVRFSLPTLAAELSLAARVVRSDDETFAPARALALAFEDVGPAEQVALQDYLKLLVGALPFSWQIADEGGRQVVTLLGVLGADTDLGPLTQLRGDVYFCMREFRRVNSESVQRWMEFIRGLDSSQRVHLIECPVAFVHHANLIVNLLERQDVRSFYAPYTCEACGLDEEKLIDVTADLDGGQRRLPPARACSSCGGPLTFDALEAQYFAFLDRA